MQFLYLAFPAVYLHKLLNTFDDSSYHTKKKQQNDTKKTTNNMSTLEYFNQFSQSSHKI